MLRQLLSLAALLVFALGAAGAGAAEADRIPAKGFAVYSNTDNFHPFSFSRRAVGDDDVLIEIMYAGICHSDIHKVKGEFGGARYPLVPGHEIAGTVVRTGKNVTRFKPGDYAGIGCMVDSCGECEFCMAGREQFCAKGAAFTYSSVDKYHGNEVTQGGYSDKIVVDEKFAIKIPKEADMKRVAPLLCAGITTYSPIKFSKVKKGDKTAVVGLGGLGHMALKYMVKLGAEVTVFEITDAKKDAALKLGAANYVNVNGGGDPKAYANTFDFVISTVPFDYEPAVYLKTLKPGGEMAIVGLPRNSGIGVGSLVSGAGKKVYGSLIGGIPETQEMIDYSVQNGIYPDVEVIPAEAAAIDKAYRNVEKGEVKFRYVIDMSTLRVEDFD